MDGPKQASLSLKNNSTYQHMHTFISSSSAHMELKTAQNPKYLDHQIAQFRKDLGRSPSLRTPITPFQISGHYLCAR